MSKEQKLLVKGKFPTLNKYTDTNRYNRYAGSELKREWTERVLVAVRYQKIKPVKKIKLKITWHEKNRRRDPDNVVFGKKFILDGLVEGGIIQNDGWKNVKGFEEDWVVDKEWQGAEVTIIEA